MQYDVVLDVKGLNCPLPLLRLKQLLSNVKSEEVIKMIATDPAVHLDVGVFIDKSKHQILFHERIDGIHYFYIKSA
ncbi:MAG: sulfurtransferase TusA family protein [Cycloclasticus sp.]|jgi:tRNA 2-thiouridine synthesizing protein A|nr:sulfurtransferase TusA family protein [Cycloclasticus sp.]|tara:strand:+ start:2950 stop:3177 length:228 start_codon:yes stop_codon:yes gene_type:complete